MEVVTGLKPALPVTLMAEMPLADIEVPDYADKLLKYLAETHKEVVQLAREAAVEHEGKDAGGVRGLSKGDLVSVRRDGRDAPQGRTRFDSRVRGEIYVVSNVLGQNTYSRKTLLGNKDKLTANGSNKHHGDRLVKLNMPTTDSSFVGRVLEYTTDGDTWWRANVKAVALDGRVYLERVDNPVKRVWANLTEMKYRWIS